jgi:ABC-type Fe3+-siderophore transport system permease subunit
MLAQRGGLATVFRIGIIGAVVVVVLGFFVMLFPSMSSADSNSTCPPVPGVSDTAKAGGELPSVANNQAPITIPVGTSRSPHTRTVTLDVQGTLPVNLRHLFVDLTDFARGDGLALDKKFLTAWVDVSRSGRFVTLALCVDPRIGGEDADPGKYTGSVIIDDPRVTGGGATFNVQIKYASVPITVMIAFLGALLGFAGAVLAAFVRERKAWNFGLGRWIGTAVLAVATGSWLWVSQYVSDPTYQGDLKQQLTLAAACFGAAYAAATAVLDVFPTKPSSE